jgi:flavin-dependent dehydrogenase
MNKKHDVIIIGGGPAGSTTATLLAKKGFDVLLLERERFPRFQIGESLLPFNNDIFQRLGILEQLEKGDFVPKYGAEFITGDGSLGYTFRFDQNLPAPHDRAFQVTRAKFDELLMKTAGEAGVVVRQETNVTGVDLSDPKRALVTTASGETLEARFVVDASGHAAFLGNRLGGRTQIEQLKSVATFAHYRNVPRPPGREGGNIVVVVLRDAWFWMIPITPEIMSVGLVASRDHVKSCGLRPEELLERTIRGTPYTAQRMKDAERVGEVRTRKDFSYAMEHIAGENFACAGDAAGFLDPIFSTGVYMAMKSAGLVADGIEAWLRQSDMRPLRAYERSFQKAVGRYLRFVAQFYTRPFLELFLHPHPRFGLIKAIVRVLAGDVWGTPGGRFKLGIFFALVALQRRFGKIAPQIEWERLPAPASV